jgi:ABC-type lipoprotein export system ATPase subunit
LPEPIAVVQNVAKKYVTDGGVVTALDSIDAVVPRGSITAFVGVSGSGKSTLLRLLAGHELPSAGSVTVGGVDLSALGGAGTRRFRRSEVAYVSQRAADNLFPHLTIAEHVPDGLRRVFERVGIADRLTALPAQLSGGELARAAFAVALARGSPLVISDEPTAELDRASAAGLLDLIAGAKGSGTTFVLATHDRDVLSIADHVVELERGRIAASSPAPLPPDGRPREQVVLRADRLSKTYGETRALAEASLELRAGELSVVVGRSGSGKSTLLMLLGGWERPDDGGDVATDLSWSHLAYVPQRFGLVPELTIRENIDLPARLAQTEGATDELLERLDLGQLARRFPAEISVGQQQRAALARGLCLRPAILLVDEPTSHQDAASAERVWESISAAAAAGTGCLVATHEPDARHRAHTSWEIEGGRLTRS